jgi:hypothetical protein
MLQSLPARAGPDEPELLDTHSHWRQPCLNQVLHLLQELCLPYSINVLDCVGRRYLVQGIANDIPQNAVREFIQLIAAGVAAAYRTPCISAVRVRPPAIASTPSTSAIFRSLFPICQIVLVFRPVLRELNFCSREKDAVQYSFVRLRLIWGNL